LPQKMSKFRLLLMLRNERLSAMQDEDEDRQRERDDDCSLGEVNENTNERKKSTKKENGKTIFFPVCQEK